MTDIMKTGINGLDIMLRGGVPLGSTILVSGKIGTGKTTFAGQFLYYGAKELGEPGIYVTVDERPEDLRKELAAFGFDLAPLEEAGLISIVDVASLVAELPSREKYKVTGELTVDNIVNSIIDLVNSKNAKRVVFDSIPALAMRMDIPSMRRTLYRLGNLLLNQNCTSIITTEVDEATNNISKFDIEEFLVRGVIVLDIFEDIRGASLRTIRIRKMRETDHDLNRRPMKITSKGIVVYPDETFFGVMEGF